MGLSAQASGCRTRRSFRRKARFCASITPANIAAPASQTVFKIVRTGSFSFVCACGSATAAGCAAAASAAGCGARRSSGAVRRCTAAGTSAAAFITLTGLLTSGTGSNNRSAASSHSAYCSRGSILPRRSSRKAASARMRTVDETRTSVIPPLPFPIRRGPRPYPKWRSARPARPFRSFRDRQNC